MTVLTDEQADQVIEKYNGLMFKENPLKIEKALPRSKGKSEKGEEDQQQSSPQSPQLVSASASPSLPVPVPQQQQREAPPTKVEEVLVKAIAVGVTTTSTHRNQCRSNGVERRFRLGAARSALGERSGRTQAKIGGSSDY